MNILLVTIRNRIVSNNSNASLDNISLEDVLPTVFESNIEGDRWQTRDITRYALLQVDDQQLRTGMPHEHGLSKSHFATWITYTYICVRISTGTKQ